MCHAAIAALSCATSGQAHAVEELLLDAKARREEVEMDGEVGGIRIEDVESVVQELYQMAGAIGSVWPETKDNKGIKKKGAHKKILGKTKEEKKKTVAGLEMEELLGEDAAAVARLGSKVDEVDSLAGRLEKASVPYNKLLESDEDEDPVRPPGRMGR